VRAQLQRARAELHTALAAARAASKEASGNADVATKYLGSASSHLETALASTKAVQSDLNLEQIAVQALLSGTDDAVADIANASNRSEVDKCAALVDSLCKAISAADGAIDSLAKPEHSPPPSKAEMLRDDAKTVITLLTGLLGLSVTFATGLVGKETVPRILLFLAWLVLGLAMLNALFGAGRTIKLAEGLTPKKDPATSLGESYYAMLLGLALVAAAVVAGWALESDELEGVDLIETARSLASSMKSDDDDTQLRVTSFLKADNLTTVTFEGADGSKFLIELNSSGDVTASTLTDG
jgi:hypothetical protein